MTSENLTMHNKVLAYLIEIVHEEAVPVNVEIGSRHVDANGDTQVDVLLEYEEPDKECVNEAMSIKKQLSSSTYLY